MASTVFRDTGGGDGHNTSQTTTSKFEEFPRSINRDNFTVKSLASHRVTWKLFYDVILYILYTCCSYPHVKGPTVTLPEEENFPNAESDSLVQYFSILYFVRHLAESVNYFKDPKYFGTEIVFRSPGKPHFLLLIRTFCPTLNLTVAIRTRWHLASIRRHIARTSASVTRDGAIPVVVWTVSL